MVKTAVPDAGTPPRALVLTKLVGLRSDAKTFFAVSFVTFAAETGPPHIACEARASQAIHGGLVSAKR